MLTEGDQVPPVVLTNQNGGLVDISTLRGKHVLVYFYPKADTPGCTQQACLLRDLRPQLGDETVIHAVAEAFDVWQEKKNYGKTYMGIVRSAFLVDPDGRIRNAWYKISPKDTPVRLLEALAS
jgi:peroxiredoxin Q/BCP